MQYPKLHSQSLENKGLKIGENTHMNFKLVQLWQKIMWKTCNHRRELNLQSAGHQSQALTTQPRRDKSRDTPTALQAAWAMPSIINITTPRTMENDQHLILSQLSSTVVLNVTSYLSDSDKKSHEKLATTAGNLYVY